MDDICSEIMSHATVTRVECVQKLKLVAIQTKKCPQHVEDTSIRCYYVVRAFRCFVGLQRHLVQMPTTD
jgi:hypothetical protein